MTHVRARKSTVRVLAASFSALALFVSCNKDPAWKKNEFAKHEVARGPDDIELPLLLWQRIEAVYTGAEVVGGEAKKAGEGGHGEGHGDAHGDAHAQGHEAPAAGHEGGGGGGHEGGGGGGEHGEAGGSSGHTSLPSEFSPIKVYLIEKNRGILRRQNHEFSFGPGGGEIDLRDIVEPKRGSFYFAVEFMPDAPPEAEQKVFFLSNGIRRKRGHEVIGNGCNTYFDVTSAFKKAMSGHGFLLNTTDQRHVSALAGTFFFAVKHEDKLHLAQLTIRDSGQRALQCRR